jgi:hypothetical protein
MASQSLQSLKTPIIAPSSLGGGPYQGWSPDQFGNNARGNSIERRIIVRAWNNPYATGTVNGRKRAIGPFRAVTNSGDFLSRKNYSCGGSNMVTPDRYKRVSNIGGVPQMCDGTAIPPSTCNPRFVPDSSDYVKFRRLRAQNVTYNEKKFGGNDSRAQYVPLMAVRRR